jgi:flagellar protein FliO/FliZ
MNSLLGPVSAFAAVVLLIPVALWLLKRTPLGASAGAAAGMQVVASLALAPNQRLMTVEVGLGDERRWLVLGVGPAGIQTLHSMAAPVGAGLQGAQSARAGAPSAAPPASAEAHHGH